MVFFLGMKWSCWFCCELSKFWVFQTLRLRLEIQEKATWHYYFCNASSMPKTLKSSYLPQYCIWQYQLVSGFKNDNNIIWWNACHCSHYQYNKSLTHRTTDSHPGHSSWSVYLQSYNWKKKKKEREKDCLRSIHFHSLLVLPTWNCHFPDLLLCKNKKVISWNTYTQITIISIDYKQWGKYC